MVRKSLWLGALALLGCVAAPAADVETTAPAATSAPETDAALEQMDERLPAVAREGSALVRSPDAAHLYLAHEDLEVVRVVSLPLTTDAAVIEVPLPGPPAAVLALDDRVLVTVRTDPGLLLVMRPDAERGLVEVGRTEVGADAWGVAVTPDERTALVTSAWNHSVSAIELASAEELWRLDVAREPRAVIVPPEGTSAYVTHLTRATLTRIDDINGDATAAEVPFGAAPTRTLRHRQEDATLSYAAVLSPDGKRMFLPRRALGAFGKMAWAGQPTVDIMLLESEQHLAVPPSKHLNMWTHDFQYTPDLDFFFVKKDTTTTGPGAVQQSPPFAQARAAVYRERTHTLLVASEGTNSLVELDALAIDPSIKALRTYALSMTDEPCGAPTGVALSEDEATAHVFCRSTHRLVAIPLGDHGLTPATTAPHATLAVKLADDPLSDAAAAGRRHFFNADHTMSDGLGCAGCHPDGRDDGHVWHHSGAPSEWRQHMHAHAFTTLHEGAFKGTPRQTPMLAGRVDAHGPYGWKAESDTLRLRVVAGFALHRWLDGWAGGQRGIERSKELTLFLREGLRPPPQRERTLTEEEERGKAVFQSADTGCAGCHRPTTDFTNYRAVSLGRWPVARDFDAEHDDNWRFKTPSLRYVGGTAPYYHDGSSPTLEHLIATNGKRMGHTWQLSTQDKKALVAYLRTL